jgi:MYXO-CTERM domain-containing protein
VGTGATPSGLATFGEFKWRNSLGNWNTSASANLFSIEATAVPEPEEYAAAAAAGLLGFGLWRRARRPA